MSENTKKPSKAKTIVGRIFATLGVTVGMVLVAVIALLFVVFRGPSESIRKLVALSFNETSAVYWVPSLFIPQAQVDEYLASKAASSATSDSVTNISLIQINASSGEAGVTETAPIYNVDDPDGDGIIVEEVHGPSFRGFMMIILDPTRVTLGKPDVFGGDGLDIIEMAEKYNAVAAINGGGFYDPDGHGSGGTPEGIVISDGEIVFGTADQRHTLVGFDKDHRLIVGTMTGREALDMNMDCCCEFGPSLIINGAPQNEDHPLESGVNPRTAIGQRSDGAVLFLVIDGRQVFSAGATLDDLVDVMMDYGAVNASNLDGGSSSTLYYEGEILNTCASVYGFRKLPTSFVVLPLGSSASDQN